MPAEDAERPAGGAAAIGFHSYADDTLRISPGATPPPRETWSDAWDEPDEPVHASPADAWPGEPPQRRAGRGTLVAVTLALLAGGAVALAWGLTPARRAPTAAQPVVAPLAAAQPPAAALTPAAPVETQAQRAPPRLMVAHAEPARVPPASARPAPPRAAPAPQARHPDETPRGRDPIGERLAALSLAPATLAPEPTPAPPPASQAAPAIAPPPPAGGCADARTPARRMVCEDPELAAADRRMARAYRAAIAAGAPERQLRAEQQDWLDVREDAARRSPRAVASIYQQRIEDLQRWRDEAAARDPEP